MAASEVEGVGGELVGVDKQLAAALSGFVGGFPASELVKGEFDAQDFVARARRTSPLEDLVQELQTHLLNLRACLVDAINQDYTTFVGMASNLRGLEKALGRVQSPVETLRAEVSELREATADAVQQLEIKLEERQSIMNSHRSLSLLLNAELGLQRMEGLLRKEEAAAKAHENSEDQGTQSESALVEEMSRSARVLERVANETARLKAEVWALGEDDGGGAKLELTNRLQALSEQLVGHIRRILGPLVAFRGREEESGGKEGGAYAGREGVLGACIRALVVAEQEDVLQQAVRDKCMAPFVAATVTVPALEDGESGSCRGLKAVYDMVLNFVDDRCLPLCHIARQALGEEEKKGEEEDEEEDGERGGKLVGRVGACGSVVVESHFYIGSCLFAELGPILLSVGARRVTHYLDKAFADKYAASMWFLSELERRCGSRKEALALRNNVAFLDFMQKWELPLRAHLQLRQQEVTAAVGPLLIPPGMLADALAEQRAKAAAVTTAGPDGKEPAPPPPPQPSLPSAIPLPRCLKPPSSSSDRPLLWLATSSRFQAAVGPLLSSPIPALSHRYLQLALMLLAKFVTFLAEWTEHIPARLAADAAERGAGGGKKGEEELLVLAAMVTDGREMQRWVTEECPTLAVAALPPLHAQQALPLVQSSIAPLAESLGQRAEAATSLLVSVLAGRCSEVLSAVGAIPSQYRMVNKAPPTKASVYVKAAVEPLKAALLPSGALGPLDGSQRADVVDLVTGKAAERFRELVDEVFVNVKKLEQTLKKLNKDAAAASSTASNGAKICLQVLLDVEELCKETEDLGAVTETIQPLHALLEMVRGVCKDRGIDLPPLCESPHRTGSN